MSKIENGIGWCDATVNALTGCTEVSPGCARCYAKVGTRARVLRAQGKETWGAKGERVPVNFEPVFRRLNKLCVCDSCKEAHPIEWLTNRSEGLQSLGPIKCRNAKCDGRLRRIRLFADSNSDWLDPKWPVETLARFLDAIRLAPNVDVLLLTKRIACFWQRLLDVRNKVNGSSALYAWLLAWSGGKPPSNVWLGVSVEDQKRADERIPLLLQTPAAIRFLSVEPLLEEVNVIEHFPQVNWVIVGLESGKNRRDPLNGVAPLVYVAEECVAAGVPVYVKQDCAFASGQQGRIPDALWKRKEFPR